MLGKVTDGLSCMSTPTTTTTMSDYTDGGCADTSVSASATDIVADKTQGVFFLFSFLGGSSGTTNISGATPWKASHFQDGRNC